MYAQIDSLAQRSYQELDSLYLKYRYNNPKKAKIYADALYAKAQVVKNDKKIGKALYRKAYIAYKLGNYQKAFIDIKNSLSIAKKIKNDSLELNNESLTGTIYLAKGDYNNAINGYIKAKSIAIRMGNLNDVFLLDHNIGMIKKQTKDLDEAIDIFLANLEAVDTYKDLDLERLEIISLVALADAYLRIKNVNNAEKYTDEGLRKSSLEKFKDAYLILSVNKVIINYQKKLYQSSIQKAYSLLKPMHDYSSDKSITTLYLYVGKNYLELQECDSVIKYFEEIKTLTKKENFEFPELKEVCSALGICYTKIGNVEKSIENQKLAATFDDKYDSINVKANNELHKKNDIVPLKEKIESLDNYGKQQKGRATILYSISAILILLLLSFLFVYRKRRQQTKKHFQTLLQTIDTLEQSQTESQPIKPTASVITDESVLEILKGLQTFEKKEYYLRQDCTLGFVAKKLKTNTSYLSNVINTYKGKSFKSYLTELRINSALIRLKNDSKLRAYTIKAIAEEFGFKRQETFSKAFKAQTNMLPSKYIKSLKTSNIKN
ncbi:MAG: helix-turn-helix domain-containing protein [Bacteroidota bacterium]